MQKRKKHFLAIACMLGLVAGCADRGPKGDTDKLNNLFKLSTYQPRSHIGKVSAIRRMALEESALTVGARAGLVSRANQINSMLEQKAKHMDQVFNFSALLLEHSVLPPVLSEGRNVLNLDSPNTLRIADRTYAILKQARFTTTPPNWRDYLVQNYVKPERPDNTMLPRNRSEQKLWHHYIREGWNNGCKQADEIFAENLAKLKQDYNGMLLYRRLLAQNMVSKPYVVRTELGVTGSGSRMDINDQVLRITALPKLNLRHHEWQARMTAKKDTVLYGKVLSQDEESK